MMTFELQVRIVFGTERIYPMNEPAKRVTELLSRRTLKPEDLKILRDLGFTIKWVANEVSF
jgi:hypothetical protein